MLRYLKLTLGSVRKRGVVATAGILATTVFDRLYDVRHGTHTLGWSSLDEYAITGPNREHGRAYQPTSAFAFKRLMSEVDIPRDVGFVDFGCGKGRVLLLAAELGFARVVGIDFVPELVADARRNAERWLARSLSTCDMRIVEGDVLDYAIEPNDAVFFLFNPFDDVILGGVLDRVERSMDRAPRQTWIIYHNPLESACIDARVRFERISSHSFWGNEFAVYRSRS